MRFNTRYFVPAACGTLLLFGVATAATAQQGNDRDRSRQQDRSTSQQREQDQQSDSQRRSERQRRRSTQQDSRQNEQQRQRVRLSPSGWVRVATDYDNDGRFDAVETIFIYDLQRARQSSQQRARRDGQQRARQSGQQQVARNSRQSTRSQTSRARSRTETIRGQISTLRRDDLAGMEGQHLIARVKTDEGRTAKVCLGPQSQLSKLNLSEGDRVTVQGVRGHINDKSMLIARQVSSDGQQVSVQMQPGRHLKRVRGEILSTRTARFRGHRQPHVVAEVELVNGKQQTVNLGPQSRLSRLDLQDGDQVSLLVRPGRINGQSAMIAEQVRAKGMLVELPRPQNAERFTRRSGESGRVRRAFRGESQDQQRGARRSENDRDQVTYDGSERAALGLMLSDSPQRGVEIQQIVSGSAAEDSDLKAGDRILSIDGDRIRSYRDVVRALQQYSPGDRIEIRVQREEDTQTISVRVGSRSELYSQDSSE